MAMEIFKAIGVWIREKGHDRADQTIPLGDSIVAGNWTKAWERKSRGLP